MELLDIYDEKGNHLGTEDRNIVHEKGLWHKTVHCWLYDKEGNVFFQRRKDRGTLYTTASGHVAAGETIKEAFGREIHEELGSNINYEKAEFCSVVNFVMDRKLKDNSIFKDRAFANIYVYEYDQKYDFDYDESEVSELVKVNAKKTKDLFIKENGTIKGETIKLVNNQLVCTINEINFSEFLVNDHETALSKYQDVLDKIIEVTDNKKGKQQNP